MDLKGTKRRSTGLETGCEEGEREVSRRWYEAVGWIETRGDYMSKKEREREIEGERERESASEKERSYKRRSRNSYICKVLMYVWPCTYGMYDRF